MKKIYLLVFGFCLTIIAHAQLPASANLKVWYDADINLIVNGSGEVTDWDDNSGNSNNAAAILTGATLETVTGNDANNYSFVRFSGNSFLSSSYGGTTTGNLTIFIVLNNATNASSAVSFRNGNDSIVYPSANYRDKYGVQLSAYPHSEDKSIGSGVTGKGFEVVAFRYERNTQVSGISTWRNGMMLSGKTSPDTALPALFLHIGGYENATQSTLATTDIAQVIVYDAALDETDMQAAFSYLSTRYNIAQNQHAFSTIAAGDWNDPLIWAGGTVPGANDDVIIAPTGPFDWVDLPGGTASCKSLIVLENAGLRLTTVFSSPTLNIGIGNGYNNEFAVKGSFYLDSAQLNIHGNWYVSCNKSDTLTEGFQLGGSATIIIDGNNGVAAQSVSSDKALVDVLNFGDAFGLSSTRLSSNVTGKIFITIVDPHFSANGITINNFSSSYAVSPSQLAAHNGALRLGNGISTQSSSNPKGFVLGSSNTFFPMKVIANSNAANNRGLTFEGFVTCHGGLTINSGAVVNSSAGLQISWDLDNNGTLNQMNYQ